MHHGRPCLKQAADGSGCHAQGHNGRLTTGRRWSPRIIQITGAATSRGTTRNYRDAPAVVTGEGEWGVVAESGAVSHTAARWQPRTWVLNLVGLLAAWFVLSLGMLAGTPERRTRRSRR